VGPPAKGSDPLVGKVLNDSVRIVRPIARGGMGQVYLGEQTRMKRRCAVKLLDPRFGAGVDAAEFNRRFLLEASVAARISHPHVVKIFDYGEAPEGCFIAMELLEGRSLSEEIARGGALSPARAVHVVLQAARALREAHALGVVHRDVKPANVYLIKQDDDDDFVKVLDFGLVHESKADGRDQGTDAIMGSPRYMAPEQVQGKEVDARADVYSLGAVLYAMLTGHPPFERRTDLATMMAQVSDPVPPMATVAPELALPAGLEAIVMKCLAKQPDARFASMDELVGALQGRDPLLSTGSGPVVREMSPLGPLAVGAVPAEAPSARRLPSPPRARRGVTPMVVVAMAGVVVAVFGAIALGRAPAPAPASAPVSAPVAAAPVVAPATAPAKATLHVETDPPGAKVTEEGETMCATTPCDVVYSGRAADPSAEHLLSFLLPGYRLESKVAHVDSAPLSVKLMKAH
jgi:serine/threonine-protein kinase